MRAELLEHLQQAPGAAAQRELSPTADGPPPTRWSLRAIRATFPWLQGYSVSGVWRLLKRHRLCVRTAVIRQHSPDPAYAAKVEQLLACLHDAAQHPGEVELVFLDEMGYYRWPVARAAWAANAPAANPVADRDGPNNKQWRVIGALNALTGRVTYRDAYIIGREKVGTFYAQVVAAYPDARRIYIVQDNWSIHRHPEVVSVLADLPTVAVVWLPTYAPWLNPIEKLWRWLREHVLTMHRWAGDWPTLRERVNAFLDQFATESTALLHYVGLLGLGKLAQALANP